MMFKLYSKILFVLIIICNLEAESFDFLHIPIQEEGRIKPLDSFARNQLLKLYGKKELTIYNKGGDNYKVDAIDWLFSVISQQKESLNQPIFKIENPDVVNILNLELNKKSIYTFTQIEDGFNIENNQQLINRLIQVDEKFLTLVEKQLLELFVKKNIFTEIFNSASCIMPMITIKDPIISNALGIDNNQKISYSYYIKNQNQIHNNLKEISSLWDEKEIPQKMLFELSALMEVISIFENELFMRNHSNSIMSSDILKIFPGDIKQTIWLSPWELIEQIKNNSDGVTETHYTMLLTLENIFSSNKPNVNLNDYKESFEEFSSVNSQILIREVNYNQSDLFFWSLIFYICTLVSLVSLSILRLLHTNYKLIPIILIIIGFMYHLSGIIIRMSILLRPPVTTLYESIVFVGLISVLFSIILGIIKKDYFSLLLGSIAGIVLHYMSFAYAADGDTLGVLVAVLNSNFWLATHVTTITTGYGVTVMCSLIGHLYLIKAIWSPNNKKQLKIIYNNMLAMTFIALFFTLFGTILGGIWGDQSWGRFWGWDPKENGALLIVMWLLMMIHLRVSGMIKAEGYALGLILANITVALAWFGVNLLSVGLHSYGFTEGVALNLFLFIAAEFIIGFSLYGFVKLKSN